MKGRAILVMAAVAAAIATAVVLRESRFDDGELSLVGREIYAQRCASCHGVKLEGQPHWQDPLSNGLMPAPPHNATGHTWHHSDEELFTITRDGMAAVVPNYRSAMPAFGRLLSDREIHAVLSFIKSTWPQKEREYQAARTRGR